MPSVSMDASSLYGLRTAHRVDLGLNSADGPRTQGEKLYDVVKSDIFMVRVEQLAWKYYCEKFTGKDMEAKNALPNLITKTLNETGLREVIVNTAVQLYEKNYNSSHSSIYITNPLISRTSQNEPIDAIKQIRIEWEQGIKEELMAIAQETARPFTIARAPNLLNRYLAGEIPRLDGTNARRDAVRFLFDSEDLLETGIGIRSPNAKAELACQIMGMIKLHLRTPSLYDLQKKYSDLSQSLTQLGLDECKEAWGAKFLVSRHEEGAATAAYGTALEARKYMRRGVPPSLRPRIWRLALALPDSPAEDEENNFTTLRSYCEQLDNLTDSLYIHDVDNVADDPRFFVFEEELKECTLCFSRDSWVWKNAAYMVHAPMDTANTANNNYNKKTKGDDDSTKGNSNIPANSPTSNVQPFLGFSIYTAPLCYIYRNRASLYSVSRALWARLWCKMNVISGDTGTLLHVCATFENLLSSLYPTLFLHLLRIGVQPLLIAMPWLQFGFVGLLEIDQVLHLWDRVIGYEDPCVLAVFAVSVFMMRAEAVLATDSPSEAVQMLMEGSRLKVVPLLQMVLFTDSPDGLKR